MNQKDRARETITELKLGMLDEQETAQVRSWLEGRLHCCMTYMSEGYYVVRFPDGTTEQATESRPQYQQESIIRLPSGVTLRKVVHWPCLYRPACTHTRLLPVEEPAPPQGDGRGRYGSRRRLPLTR
jgi:hypothetical protein